MEGGRETGGRWKKTKVYMGGGPQGIAASSLTQDWDLLCGLFMLLVERKGSNAQVNPGFGGLRLIQLREVL